MNKVAINNGPRTWSSYSNITTKDDRRNSKMNSVENILEYRNLNSTYYSPPLFRKTAATTYDFPEQPAKKDKKWSLGSFFRRKKKEESDSTSDEEPDRKGFLNRRKKKSDKRKKTKQRATFDHVILPTTGAPVFNGHNNHDENGILSDPTGGFSSYTGRVLTRTPNQSRRNCQYLQSPKELVNSVNASRSSLGSTDSLYKNSRKFQVKIRAEARRETNICASSSDEDSQRSASSSRLRSDESINKLQEASTNKKSRAARTERYIRRISKDEEVITSGLRTSKSDAENNIKRLILFDEKKEVKGTGSKSPMPQNTAKLRVVPLNSGLSTIPPSHANNKRNNVDNINIKPPPISIIHSNRYSSLTSTESKDSYPNYQRSVSYDADIHKSASPEISTEVIHAQLPLGKPSHRFRNLSLVEQPNNTCFKQPPPPPPRDPWRIGTVQHIDHTRPMSYCFERTQRTYAQNDFLNNKNNQKPHSFNWRSNVRSTSEDHLPSESSPIPFHPRPSSATSDHPNQLSYRRNQDGAVDQYQYVADKNPRSRKPISIQSFKEEEKNKSPDPLDFWRNKTKQDKPEGKPPSEAQKALDFWKQKEEEGKHMDRKSSIPSSPQIFTASAHVRTNIFLPSVLKSDLENGEENKRLSPFKPISPQICSTSESANQNTTTKFEKQSQRSSQSPQDDNNCTSPNAIDRKSSNLEDALDELEAIYKSLRLGDEDLLERAEERERSIAAKKIMEMNLEVYPGCGAGIPRGAISDSSFSYEPFDSVDSPKKKRLLKKYRNCDRKNDDMAVRKLNKERSSTISDPKEVISKVSYLLASPLHGVPDDIHVTSVKSQKEPDITYDDVVFRTMKHANNTLKVTDPQPPFGIPVGPVLPASNSDYLHAMPEETPKYTVKNRKIPDIVKDDLAYRNLRKDSNKDPVLPSCVSDDFLNNNNPIPPLKSSYSSIKKNRAVRSLSANIYNLIQNEPFLSPYSDDKAPQTPKEKSSIDDIADAMEIARQILREKEEKISATRKAFLSDTEAKYKKLETGNSYLTESRMNFLNNMKSKDNERDYKGNGMKMENYVTSKPPRGITLDRKPSKEASSSPTTPDALKVILFEKIPVSPSTSDSSKPISLDIMPLTPNTPETSKLVSYDPRKEQSSSADLLLTNAQNETAAKQSAENTENSDSLKDKLEELAGSADELTGNGQHRSSLEDLLTAFAVEAQEASRRIADELKQLENNIHFNKNILENLIAEPATVEEIKSFDEANKRETLSNILKEVEMVAVTEIEPDITEDTEGLKSHPVSVANIVQTRCESSPADNEQIITDVQSDSEHDYVNMGSDAEIEKAIPLIDESVNDNFNCKSPYEENKADLIAGFQELKRVTSNGNLRIQDPNLLENLDERDDGGTRSGGEECALKCDTALTLAESNKQCAFLTRAFINVSANGSIVSSDSGSNIDAKTSNEAPEIVENNELRYEAKLFIGGSPNSVAECELTNRVNNRFLLNESPHSSGFHSNSDAEANDDDINNDCFKIPSLSDEDSLSSLKSPKLVLNSTLNLESLQSACNVNHSNISTDSAVNIPSTSSDNRSDNKYSSSKADGCPVTDRRHTLSKNTDSNLSWCIDPLVLAFACSYGVACTYHYVTMDIVTILGLLFVFVSFIAALIL